MTNWKEQTTPAWGQLARSKGAYIHVGRVNSMRRIRLCIDAGVNSVDGTGPTRFCKVTPRLNRATRSDARPSLFGDL